MSLVTRMFGRIYGVTGEFNLPRYQNAAPAVRSAVGTMGDHFASVGLKPSDKMTAHMGLDRLSVSASFKGFKCHAQRLVEMGYRVGPI